MQLIGLTPIIDNLISEIGLYQAYLYGYYWRQSQGNPGGEISTGHETTSEQTGLSRSTVIKHTQLLIDNDYLIDTTPNAANKPHVYKLTGKIRINANLTMSHCINLDSRPVDNSEFAVCAANPQGVRREPSGCAPRTPGGMRREPQTTHDHDHDDDYILQCIKRHWLFLKLDKPALVAMIKHYNNDIRALNAVLDYWVENIAWVPENWGPGAIYNAIKRGEVPEQPEPEPLISEIEAIMEYQQKNGIGIYGRIEPETPEQTADYLELSSDPGVRAAGREFRKHAERQGF